MVSLFASLSSSVQSNSMVCERATILFNTIQFYPLFNVYQLTCINEQPRGSFGGGGGARQVKTHKWPLWDSEENEWEAPQLVERTRGDIVRSGGGSELTDQWGPRASVRGSATTAAPNAAVASVVVVVVVALVVGFASYASGPVRWPHAPVVVVAAVAHWVRLWLVSFPSCSSCVRWATCVRRYDLVAA